MTVPDIRGSGRSSGTDSLEGRNVLRVGNHANLQRVAIACSAAQKCKTKCKRVERSIKHREHERCVGATGGVEVQAASVTVR